MNGPADSVEEMVASTIARICSRARVDITPATTMQSLGIDSLAMPAVVARLEALFEHEFDHEQTLDFLAAVSVEDVAALVRKTVGRASAQPV